MLQDKIIETFVTVDDFCKITILPFFSELQILLCYERNCKFRSAGDYSFIIFRTSTALSVISFTK